MDSVLDKTKHKMQATVDAFAKELSGVRAGRANIGILEPIKVDVYGSMVSITQVASVSVVDPRMLSVNVWDVSNVKAVEKAIKECGGGFNPMTEGNSIRVPVPPLSSERRQELVKMVARYAEDSKIAIRNVRKDGMNSIKNMEKNGDIGKDDMHKLSDKIEEYTKHYVAKIDEMLSEKEKDIMQN